jgi:hypothetical protein
MSYVAAYMRECDSGIFCKEEDPTDEAYNPKCRRNVYIDNINGKFASKKKKIASKTIYYNVNDDIAYYGKVIEYLDLVEEIYLAKTSDEDYEADNEKEF